MNKEDLLNKIKEIFADDAYTQPTYKLGITQSEVQLLIKKMYKHVEIKFIHLDKLSELFETKDINLGDKESYGGCITCDFGSSYKQTIYIKDYKIKIDD